MIYQMKKIVSHSEEIPLPLCMYHLKNVYREETADELESDLKITEQKPKVKMAEIEKRQDHLLKQLDVLYERIISLSLICKNELVSAPISRKTMIPQIPAPADLVINASANHLPYFLAIVAKKSLKEKITLTSHIHSSVPSSQVDTIKKFIELLNVEKFTGPVQVKLIFKEVSANTELKWCVNKTPIIGEVNILRYLSFIFPEAIPYEESLEEDSLLDECYILQRTKSSDVQDSALRTIFASYKGDWILGTFSIVDIAAISVIKQLEGCVQKLFKFTPKPWFTKASQLLE